MFNALAAGRKVYGQGGYAPNRGQVSAEGARGYLQREVRNNAGNRNLFGGVSRVGSDGKSDTRSGVAARALNKQMYQNNGRPQQRQAPTGGGGTSKPPKNPQQPQQPSAPPAPIINKDGVLELPFNMQVSQDILSAQQDMNQQLMGLQTQQEQGNLDFNRNMRQTDTDYRNLQRASLNNAGGRGTIFSSGYGQTIGDNANAYGTQKNDLISQNSLFNADTERQRLGIQTAFQNMMSQFALDQANAAGENAGSLGYGQPNKSKGPNAGPAHHKFKHQPGDKKRRGGKK